MKKILYTFLILIAGFKAFGQDAAPVSPKPVTGQFFVTTAGDTVVYVYKGAALGWSRLLRYKEAQTVLDPKIFTGSGTALSPVSIKFDTLTHFNGLVLQNDSGSFTKTLNMYWDKAAAKFQVVAPINFASDVYLNYQVHMGYIPAGSLGDSILTKHGGIISVVPSLPSVNLGNSDLTGTANRTFHVTANRSLNFTSDTSSLGLHQTFTFANSLFLAQVSNSTGLGAIGLFGKDPLMLVTHLGATSQFVIDSLGHENFRDANFHKGPTADASILDSIIVTDNMAYTTVGAVRRLIDTAASRDSSSFIRKISPTATPQTADYNIAGTGKMNEGVVNDVLTVGTLINIGDVTIDPSSINVNDGSGGTNQISANEITLGKAGSPNSWFNIVHGSTETNINGTDPNDTTSTVIPIIFHTKTQVLKTPVSGHDIANKAYVDGIAAGGAPNALIQDYGIVAFSYNGGTAGVKVKADSTVLRTGANSYSLAGMQTKLNNYLLKTDTATTVKSKSGFLTDYNNLSGRINTNATNISNEVTRATGAEALKAPLASPALTGSPTAPTQTTGDNTAKIATDAFVNASITAIATPNLQSVATAGNGFTGQIQAQTFGVTGTGGAGFIDLPLQSTSPASATNHLRIYPDSLNRLSWKNSLYRRTIRVPYPSDYTINMPYQATSTVLEDSTHSAATYSTITNLNLRVKTTDLAWATPQQSPYGADTTGVVDATTALRACLAANLNVRISGKLLLSDTITLRSGQHLYFDNAIITDLSTTKAVFVANGVTGWSIDGKLAINGAGNSSGTAAGIHVYGGSNGVIQGVTFKTISGYALLVDPNNTNYNRGNAVQISNCVADNDYIGVQANATIAGPIQGSEYYTVSNFNITNCTTAANIYAGNWTWSVSNFEDNTNGVLVDGSVGANGAHGMFTGDNFNHNTNYNFKANGVALGETMVNDHFYGTSSNNIIETSTSIGINFTACIIDGLLSLDATSLAQVNSCQLGPSYTVTTNGTNAHYTGAYSLAAQAYVQHGSVYSNDNGTTINRVTATGDILDVTGASITNFSLPYVGGFKMQGTIPGTISSVQELTSTNYTDATNKFGTVLATPAYLNADNPIIAMWVSGLSGRNRVIYGGGAAGYSGVFDHDFYTTATTNTAGTEKMRLDNTGLQIGGTFGSNTFMLNVQGTLNTTGAATINSSLGVTGAVTLSNYTTAGILHNAVTTGAVTSSQIVNADIASSTIDLTAKVTGLLPNSNLANSGDNSVAALQYLGSVGKAFTVGSTVYITNNPSALVNQQIIYTAVYLPIAATITGVKVWSNTNGSYTSSGFNGVASYTVNSATGLLTQEAISTTSATVWQSGTGLLTIPFSSTVAMTAGVHYIAIIYDRSAETTAPKLYMVQPATITLTQDFPNSIKLFGTVASQTTMPSTQASSGITATNTGVYCELY